MKSNWYNLEVKTYPLNGSFDFNKKTDDFYILLFLEKKAYNWFFPLWMAGCV